MADVFISVGSNVDPLRNIPEALRRLARIVKLTAMSTFYRTTPVGPPGQPQFVNGMVRAQTDIPPRELKFGVLRRIEAGLGRQRTADRYAPRPIDLDIAVYDSLVIDAEDLKIPDPDIRERPFLAIPLHELAPTLVVPGTGRPVAELARRWKQAPMAVVEDWPAAASDFLLKAGGL